MPDALLDLNLEQVKAVVAGYSERELDAECRCILTGYYAGYYMGAKRPKKPADLIRKLVKSHDKLRNSKHVAANEEPDVEFFRSMDSKRARFKLKEMSKDAVGSSNV